LVLLRRRFVDPELGEADPGGLGACPQQISTLSYFLLFQKRSKSTEGLVRLEATILELVVTLHCGGELGGCKSFLVGLVTLENRNHQ
jgi:hypothetical protein